MEKVYVFDRGDNPDNKRVYTAETYVESNKKGVQGPYRFSSFPNNDSKHNTVNAGEHLYNNKSGHKGRTTKGLNIVDENGGRFAPGFAPNGKSIEMKYVNVHSGVKPEDNNGKHNRGSEGCLTCHPSDAKSFFENFDFSGKNENTGNAEGTVTIFRGISENSQEVKDFLLFKQKLQSFKTPQTIMKSDETKRKYTPNIVIEK